MATRGYSINISIDASEADRLLDELSAFMQTRPDSGELILNSLDTLDGVFTLHREVDPASGADDCIFRLKPSKGFLHLISALRAGDIDRRV